MHAAQQLSQSDNIRHACCALCPQVTAHRYQYLYSKYLSQLHTERLRMLEIGLGCDMVGALCCAVLCWAGLGGFHCSLAAGMQGQSWHACRG